jgi:hypothetical protein
MTPTARAHTLFGYAVADRDRYFQEHGFRLTGKTLHCPGLCVGPRRVDTLTFSTPELAQKAWDAIVDNLMAALLERAALRCVRKRYNSHSADRDRRRDLKMASMLRSRKPYEGYPRDVHAEMMLAAGFTDPRSP